MKSSITKERSDPRIPTKTIEKHASNSLFPEGNLRMKYLYKEMLTSSNNTNSLYPSNDQVSFSYTESLSNNETSGLVDAKNCNEPSSEVLRHILKSKIASFKYLPISGYKTNCICLCRKQQSKNVCRQILTCTDCLLKNGVSKNSQYNSVLGSKYHVVQYNPLYKSTDSL